MACDKSLLARPVPPPPPLIGKRKFAYLVTTECQLSDSRGMPKQEFAHPEASLSLKKKYAAGVDRGSWTDPWKDSESPLQHTSRSWSPIAFKSRIHHVGSVQIQIYATSTTKTKFKSQENWSFNLHIPIENEFLAEQAHDTYFKNVTIQVSIQVSCKESEFFLDNRWIHIRQFNVYETT